MTKKIEKIEKEATEKTGKEKTKEEEEKCLWESKVRTWRLPQRHWHSTSIDSTEDGIACATQQS